MEQQFREIGLKFKLDNAKWYLLEDFVVSKEGEKLSAEQVKMLRHLEKRIDEFKIKVTSHNNKTGEFTLVDAKGYFDGKTNEDGSVNSDDLVIS